MILRIPSSRSTGAVARGKAHGRLAGVEEEPVVPMKYAIILPAGSADEPVDELDGRTPLEAANTPNTDWISKNGRQGRVVTVPRGFPPGSDVATLTLLGYDPRSDHHGWAPLEALAREIKIGPGELVFRCDFVTVTDGCLEDYTAGHISQREADQLIASLNEQIGDRRCRFHAGQSYRNLVVVSDAPGIDPRCTPPHDFPDQSIQSHAPRGSGASWAQRVMDRARSILADHDVNLVRRDLGENPATDIWLWGHGKTATIEPFRDRFGLRSAVIAGVDLVRGMAISLGMNAIEVAGATGSLDTDYAAKGAAAVRSIDAFDLVIVHIEAADEAGHQGDLAAKMTALERIDEEIVGQLLECLRGHRDWKIMIAADHPTPVGRCVHAAEPPPFCIAGRGVQTVLNRPFSERSAAESDLQIDPGFELMEYFLKR